jgi:hypothetical protein
MQTLFSGLGDTRATLSPDAWRWFCQHVCLAHPIHELVHQDPLSRYSYEKPRSYAGDAVLLDLLYGEVLPVSQRVSRLGWEVYRFLCKQDSVTSLRSRRDMLAQWIDELAAQVPEARILSVACGHLREAFRSHAVREQRFGEFLALDQDPKSLDVVAQELGPLGVQVVPGSVKALLKGTLRFSGLDFIYAAGLFDYLPQPVAINLARVLFAMLRSGGRLLLANYADPVPDAAFKAYMEAFMDWWLLYRNEAQVEEWLRELPKRELSKYQLFRDATHNIIYLEAIHV